MADPKKRKVINRTEGANKATKRSRAGSRNVTSQSENKLLESAALAVETSPLLVLRIAYASLGAESTTSDTVGRDKIPSVTPYLNVLSGRVDDLNLYASTCGGANWLRVVAHDVFDPVEQRGELLTHSEGTSNDWCARVRNDTDWRVVAVDETLKPSVYEYVMPAGVEVYMPKICLRQSRSATSKNLESRHQAARFRKAVTRRDVRCVATRISEQTVPLIASHIIPRRLQSQVSAITQRYVHTSEKDIVDKDDPRIGCLFNENLCAPFERFSAGLFRDPGNPIAAYTMHVFMDPIGVTTVYTGPLFCHGSTITYESSLRNIPADTSASSLPPCHNAIEPDDQNTSPLTPPGPPPSMSDTAQALGDTLPASRDKDPQFARRRQLFQSDDLDARKRAWDDEEKADENDDEIQHNDYDEQEQGNDAQDVEDDVDSDYQDENTIGSEFPPAGLFAWHYAQCVLQRFGSPDLSQIPGVQFHEKPSRYRDDYDSDDDWDPATTSQELPYPSYGLERFVAMNALKREIGAWSANVTK